MRKLSHPSVVKLKEVIRENDELFFVFEYLVSMAACGAWAAAKGTDSTIDNMLLCLHISGHVHLRDT